jgi:hypothetical protein
MNFVGDAVARGVRVGITHGVACNVSRAVSSGIKDAYASTSRIVREQTIVPNPTETKSQKIKKKMRQFVIKLKKKVKKVCTKKPSTSNISSRPNESRFDLI